MGAGETGIALLKWIVIFTAICAIMLILRAWSARIQNRKAYIDDWLVVIAFVSLRAPNKHHTTCCIPQIAIVVQTPRWPGSVVAGQPHGPN